MLFEFQFLTHNINRVNEIPLFFLEESIIQDRYSENLYPVWFRPVLKRLPAVKENFKRVYTEIKNIKDTKTAELLILADSLRDGNDISILCSDTSLDGPRTEFVSGQLHEALKILYGTFFKETLKDSVTLFSAIAGTYKDHYYKFRKLNFVQGKVCPMCGIHEYPLIIHEPIAQYDHWLPQDIYPLFAINYRNLVPICGYCNGIKLNQDLIYNNDRTTSFYPYLGHGDLSFEIISYTPFDKLGEELKQFHPHGFYEIEISPINKADAEKIQNWNRVFDIKNRSATFISEYYDDLKDKFKKYLKEKKTVFHDGAPKADLENIVDQFKANRIDTIRREKGSHLKQVFLEYLKEKGNEHLLYTFFDIKAI